MNATTAKHKNGKRSLHLKVTPEVKAKIGKYTDEHGFVSAIQKLSQQFPTDSAKERTVHSCKQLHLRENKMQKRQVGGQPEMSYTFQ